MKLEAGKKQDEEVNSDLNLLNTVIDWKDEVKLVR
jgi:hypothetical protein